MSECPVGLICEYMGKTGDNECDNYNHCIEWAKPWDTPEILIVKGLPGPLFIRWSYMRDDWARSEWGYYEMRWWDQLSWIIYNHNTKTIWTEAHLKICNPHAKTYFKVIDLEKFENLKKQTDESYMKNHEKDFLWSDRALGRI